MHELDQKAKVSKNFARHEYACKCGCGYADVDAELSYIVQGVRDYFQKPITITSGCRCEEHNAKVGGSPNSAHKQGIAADIVVHGVDPAQVYDFLDLTYYDRYGVGKYSDFTHIDVRQRKARW